MTFEYTTQNITCVVCGKQAPQTFDKKGNAICGNCYGTKCFRCCKYNKETKQ